MRGPSLDPLNARPAFNVSYSLTCSGVCALEGTEQRYMLPVMSTFSAPPPAPQETSAPGLRAGMVWTVLGQGLYSVAQWLMVILLARSGGPEQVGRYSLALALTAPLFLFLGLQLRGVQATDAARQFDFRQYFTLRQVSMVLGVAFTVGLAALYPHASGPIWWLGVAKALEGWSDVLYGLWQQRERLDWIAQSTMIRGVLGLVCLAVIYSFTGNLTLATLGIAAAGLAVLLAYDLPRGRRVNPGPWWQPPLSGDLLRLTLPLGLVIALVSLGVNIPRLFIQHHLGAAPLGIYSALTYVVVAGSVLITALGTALTTRLSQLFARAEYRAFLRLTLLFTGVAALIGAVLSGLSGLAGSWLLHLLYGPDYARHADLFFWLTAAGSVTFIASCAGFAITAARQFKEQLPLFMLVTLVLILSCWWFIPRHGLYGAAIATLVSAAVQWLGSWWIVLNAIRRRQRSGAAEHKETTHEE